MARKARLEKGVSLHNFNCNYDSRNNFRLALHLHDFLSVSSLRCCECAHNFWNHFSRAIIFPFKAKNIFDTSPPVVRRKIGKIPVISLLGIAGVILASYLSYATLQPAVTPPPSSVPLINLLAYVFIPLTGAIALVIYTVAYYYRKSRGIDIGLVFREIPPE